MRNISVEPLSKANRDRVVRLLSEARFVHRHLDWHPVEFWLDKQPAFLYMEDNHITGFISCCEAPREVAWVHIFAASHESIIHFAWRTLFEHIRGYFTDWKRIQFAAIPLNNYFQNELISTGFRSRNKIIVFQKKVLDLPVLEPSSSCELLPCNTSDLDSLLEIDHRSFTPLWQLTREAFLAASENTYYSTKLILQGQTIGYQLTTRRGTSAHLARIAVLPEHQGKGFARRMLDDLFLYSGFNKIEEITVNTQSDNARSVQLYTSYGFIPQAESYPIYTLA